jgi:recombination protein RecA
VRNLILDNPEMAQELETKILEAISGKTKTTTA